VAASESSVFRRLVERWADERGEARAFDFPECGVTWTWRQARDAMTEAAAGLHALGVAHGDVVAVQAHNTPALFQALLGTTALGGLISPLNPAFRGALLEHAVQTTAPKVIVCEAAAADFLARCELPSALAVLVLTEPTPSAVVDKLASRVRVLAWEDLAAAAAEAESTTLPDLHDWDPYGVVFTSGTTGLSKGSLNTYGQLAATVRYPFLRWAEPDDVFQLDLPMFHVSGLMEFMAGLQVGGRLVVFRRVSVEAYWDRVAEHRVTHVTMLPSVISFLWNRPPAPADIAHRLRRIVIGRYPPFYVEWATRFAIPHVALFYNMTEASAPLVTPLDPPLTCGVGKPRPGVQVRLVDEHDLEVPPGAAGELIIRTDAPGEMSAGYINNAEATASAWRNGWFHTGDLFRIDDDGNYHLVDRLTDSIRRRSENISSFEVEREVLAHPAVAECSVVGVPATHGDDEIMLWVLPRAGHSPTPDELIRFVAPRLPYFMVPRYVELTDELPRTSSQRIHKAALRERGVSALTWDREDPAHRIDLRNI
jgi:carnitine-CoA ligase